MLEIHPLCSGVTAFPSGPNPYIHCNFSHVFPPSLGGVINHEKVYSAHANAGNSNVYKADNKRLRSSLRDTYGLSAIVYSSNAMK